MLRRCPREAASKLGLKAGHGLVVKEVILTDKGPRWSSIWDVILEVDSAARLRCGWLQQCSGSRQKERNHPSEDSQGFRNHFPGVSFGIAAFPRLQRVR